MMEYIDSFILGLAARRANVSLIVVIYRDTPRHSPFANITARAAWAFIVSTIPLATFKGSLEFPAFFLILAYNGPARDFVQAFQRPIIRRPRRVVIQYRIHHVVVFITELNGRKPFRTRIFNHPIIIPISSSQLVPFWKLLREQLVHIEFVCAWFRHLK